MTEEQVAEWRQKKYENGIITELLKNIMCRTKARRSTS